MLILIITQNYVFGRTFCFFLCINYNCICLFWFFAFDKVVAVIFLSKWCSRTAVLDNKWVCLAGMGGYNAHWQDAFVSETNTQHSNTATSSTRTLQFVFVHNFLLHLFVFIFCISRKTLTNITTAQHWNFILTYNARWDLMYLFIKFFTFVCFS